MILKLINNENTYEFNVTDLNEGVKLYYHFEIPTVDIPDGKYNMQLLDGETVIYEDIVCIGDFKGATIQYKRGENIYINAPLDGKFEDVTVEITATQTTVYPNDGFDAMTSVVIDATPVYENGYNTGNADGYESGYESGSTDGYNIGNADGYETGYNVGVAEQKSKLEFISITENGTYSREDGYNQITVEVPDLNGSFDKGYTSGYTDGQANGIENAGEIIAETARVLDITENGKYLTKYSDPIYPDITGVYPDGENFYSYATLVGETFDTGIIPDENTILEMWWNNKDVVIDQNEEFIIGSQPDFVNQIWKLCYARNFSAYRAEIAGDNIDFQLNNIGWHHFKMSFADGFWVDGEKLGDFTTNVGLCTDTIKINGGYNSFKDYQINSIFGMIKINDIVIIPTDKGFLNINTNEILPSTKSGVYVYVEEKEIQPEGNLIKTVNVNVVPKISVKDSDLKLGFSRFTEIPEWAYFDGVRDMGNMFYNCLNLTSIPENFDTSNVTNMENMLYNCLNLTSIPELNTSNVTSMQNMFNGCQKLTSIPELNTSNVTSMQNMFANCSNLTTISPLDCSSIGTGYNSTAWFGYSNLNKLTDIGGFINLKISSNSDYGLQKCPNLTYESCINILNGLYDFTGNGETPTSNQGQLKVHSNFLTTVGNEISIGTSKGWTITA